MWAISCAEKPSLDFPGCLQLFCFKVAGAFLWLNGIYHVSLILAFSEHLSTTFTDMLIYVHV